MKCITMPVKYYVLSTDIFLQIMDVISKTLESDENLDVLFEAVTLTIVELYASTVKKDRCPNMEQMRFSEVR